MYAGDEWLSDEQQNPELVDDNLSDSCEECRAEQGEQCRPYCIATGAGPY